MPTSFCRVVVLDGGFPAWTARALPTDSESLPEHEMDAAAVAAKSPPPETKFQANLQVCIGKRWNHDVEQSRYYRV